MSDELQTNELTFQKLFSSLKRSFVRILIFAVVFAILGGGITAIVAVASNDSTEYSAIIEYNYTGVENGKDPMGNMLDISRVKSALVVSDALKNMGIVDSNHISQYSPMLIDNIAIIGFVSSQTAAELEKNSTLSYFPTRYTVKLTPNSKLPFTDTQYVNFLNELVKSYQNYFKDAYNYGKVLSLSVADPTLAANSDYYDLCVDYRLAIDKLLSELSTLKDKATDKYNKLNSNLSVLKNEINTIENYIIGNNVSKENATLTLADNLKSRKTNYEKLSEQYASRAAGQFDAIEAYDNSSSKTTSDGKLIDIITTESKYYDEMMKIYNDYLGKQHSYTYQAAVLAEQIEKNEGVGTATAEQRAAADAMLTAFDSRIKNTLDTVNNELEWYSQNIVAENGLNIVMPATQMSSSNYLLIVVVTLVCGFIGCLAGWAVAEILSKRQIGRSKKVVEKTVE